MIIFEIWWDFNLRLICSNLNAKQILIQLNNRFHGLLSIFLFSFLNLTCLVGQVDVTYMKKKVEEYKKDSRGPYKDIRWFCPDGSFVAPKDTCKQEGGFQRARYKDELVMEVWNKHKLYLGQILKGTDKEEFLDKDRRFRRAKHYLIEHYLTNVDDGWIHQKSQFYRGAVQSEDESEWGKEFLEWIFSNAQYKQQNYYLYREFVKYIPHGEENNILSNIRSISKAVADKDAGFMDIRTKIHGNLQEKDIELVEAYISKKQGSTTANLNELNSLLDYMNKHFKKSLKDKISGHLSLISSNSQGKEDLRYYLEIVNSLDANGKLIRTADWLEKIKLIINGKSSGRESLAWMDISIILEQYLLSALSDYNPAVLKDEFEYSCYLTQVLNATGYLYDWEYEELLYSLTSLPDEKMLLTRVNDTYRNILRGINWSSALINTEFGDQLEVFSSFEPKAEGFIDDRIRSSALLLLGKQASKYGEYVADKANWKNSIFGKSTGSIQGINPGIAKGKIVLVENPALIHEFDPAAIYVFRKSPADLEPVAGILSISEGNVVSHLQLLARNLGIPNANITEEMYNQLKSYSGEEVFYAVSNRGGVVIKKSGEMDGQEKALFEKKTIDEQVIRVPTESLNLEDVRIYSLQEIDVNSSGVLCGPKAANFSRLKKLFPDQLVDGLVIPFSVFRDHMDQLIPGREISYWEFLIETFNEEITSSERSDLNDNMESYILNRLGELRRLILEMPLKDSFIEELKSGFVDHMGKPLGEVPVFLRSDTNMEDLKDFTGAGLNLTIFNTIDKQKILNGVKEVWASPYTERSFKWRQKFLLNPEDVYPSILVIPSVFVDYSGVIITKDFIDGIPGRYNVAFSQGAGGAVDGQEAESWILSPDGKNILVSPARDYSYKYLAKSGGTATAYSHKGSRILSNENIADIWKICYSIQKEMPNYGMQAPYDIELGFESDKLWLFQIRPFVENKNAVASTYLNSLNPEIPLKLQVSLDEKIVN